MLSAPSFRSAFVFSVNSLICSGFSLTSFHLAEASLSAFLWLYTLVCAIVRKYHEIYFIYQGRSEGTSSVAFEVLKIKSEIDFINLFIFNCLT